MLNLYFYFYISSVVEITILTVPLTQNTAASHGVRAVMMGAQPTSALLKEFADLLDNGQLKAHVGKVFPLEQARQAQEHKRHGHTRGKIVLQIAE